MSLLLAPCSKLATMFIDGLVFALPFSGTFLLLSFLSSGRDPLPDELPGSNSFVV
jgi:hypothetical protein